MVFNNDPTFGRGPTTVALSVEGTAKLTAALDDLEAIAEQALGPVDAATIHAAVREGIGMKTLGGVLVCDLGMLTALLFSGALAKAANVPAATGPATRKKAKAAATKAAAAAEKRKAAALSVDLPTAKQAVAKRGVRDDTRTTSWA